MAAPELTVIMDVQLMLLRECEGQLEQEGLKARARASERCGISRRALLHQTVGGCMHGTQVASW